MNRKKTIDVSVVSMPAMVVASISYCISNPLLSIVSDLYNWMMQGVSTLVLSVCTFSIVSYSLLSLGLILEQWSSLYQVISVCMVALMVFLSIGMHSLNVIRSTSVDRIKTTGARFSFSQYATVRCLYSSYGALKLFGDYK